MSYFKIAALLLLVSLAPTSSAWLRTAIRKFPHDSSGRCCSWTFLEARKQNTPVAHTIHAGDAARRRIPTTLPSSTKRVQVSIPRGGLTSSSSTSHHYDDYPLPIQVYQVNDRNWWEGEDADSDSNDNNRYGGRCWPSSLAVAEFLVNYHYQYHHQSNNTMVLLELACGPGIPSLAAAAYCGAQVTATDISPVALGLLRDGWSATRKKILKKKPKQEPDDAESSTWTPPPSEIGSLSVQSFDIFSNDPLPLTRNAAGTEMNHNEMTTTTQPIVLGCSVLYDAQLARGMARRFVEACREHNAWVIVGDDDTGERDGGRKVFLDELLQRLENSDEHRGTSSSSSSSSSSTSSIPRVWTHSKVRNEALGWRDKTSHLLHLNPPASLLELLKE